MLRLPALLTALFLLVSCGFQPVYGTVDDREHLELSTYLAGVEVAPISGREGQQLRIMLEDRLNPADSASIYDKSFRLNIALKLRRDPVIVQPDGSIARYQMVLTSTYRLTDVETGESMDSGQIRRISSFDVPIEKFAVYVAERDATRRALTELSEEYRMRLIAYFARHYKLSTPL